MASENVIKAFGVVLEVTGAPAMSKEAARVFLRELDAFPEPQVLAALHRCMREVKGKLTLSDVVGRIDDGRPTPEMAWSMIPKDEAASVVWTEEMREAYAVARPLIVEGDLVAGRMAFLEAYRAAVQRARDARAPVVWSPSLGHDQAGRELALLDAAEKGHLSVESVRELLPHHREDEGLNARLIALANASFKRLSGNVAPLPGRAA